MHFIQKFVEKPLVVILIIILSMAVGIFAIASNAKLETNLNNYMPSSHLLLLIVMKLRLCLV